MTEKEIALRLHELLECNGQELRDEIAALADELDPPKPEHKTEIWIVLNPRENPVWQAFLTRDEAQRYAERRYWKRYTLRPVALPAHLLGPRQVAVDVPPTSDWPKKAERLQIYMEYWPYNRSDVEPWTEKEVTRKEAERMEVEDE